MRNQIFYWKCDSPIPVKDKINCFFRDKYTDEVKALVLAAASDFLGRTPKRLDVLKSDGNHLTAKFADHDTVYFFRADEGKAIDDDYLLAESTVMNLLNREGLPVPPVHHTDISMLRYPFRYQIMEYTPFSCLNKFAKARTLDEFKIAEQSGHFLAKLHSNHFSGYGFFNTEKLFAGESLIGLDESAEVYFRKCLEKHLVYLKEHSLISPEMDERIRTILTKGVPLLSGVKGTLVHRDYTYWNILGSETKIERVIDWDDSVSSDPADDFGIINCFLNEPLLERILQSYKTEIPLDDSFRVRIHLHTLRNMLWKTMIRDYMGYFDKGKDFFLSPVMGLSLRDYTLQKVETELKILEETL